MRGYTTIEISLPNETVSEINKIIAYENLKNNINQHLNRNDKFQITDFVTGCINKYIDEINKIYMLSNDNDGKLQNKFKQIMEEKRINAKQLSNMTNIIPSTLSNILSNNKQPSLDSFIKIWIALGMPDIQQTLYRK